MPPRRPGRVFVATLLAAALLAIIGCKSQPQFKALTKAEFALDGETKRTMVSTQVAEEIKLRLPRIAAADYRWEIFAHDSRFLRQTSEISPPEGPDRISFVTFLALRPTARPTLVRFLLVRDNGEKETQPVDSNDVAIEIKPREP
jgi:hypothetical protein